MERVLLRALVGAIAVVWLATADAAAQTSTPAISLSSLIDDAVRDNPDLTALRQEVAVARERPAQERALAPPTVEGTIWQWPINSVNPADTNMYMFMVGQDLPGRGKRDLRAASAEKDGELAESNVAILTRDIVNQVKQQYAALYVARKASELHATNVEVLSELADAAQTRYAAGQLTQQDVLNAVLALSKIHSDVLTFNEQADIAAAHLNALINRLPDTPFGPLEEPADSAIATPSSELQRLALGRHPELQRTRLETKRAESELAVARSDYKPDFTVQAGYLLMPHQTDALLARVGITWPSAPWSRTKLDAHVAELTAAVETARARERAMEATVRLAVQDAYVHASAAQARATLLRTTILPQAQQTFDVARVSYAAGRLAFRDLLDSDHATLEAQLDYIRAKSEFAQAVADLERAIGVDLPSGTIAPVAGTERSAR